MTLYFPQMTQFPILKKRSTRTIANYDVEGGAIKISDPAATLTEWTLAYAGLSDPELKALEDLFLACEGALNEFTFLDPTDNLFSSSGALADAAWEKDPLLTVTASIPDAFGANSGFQIMNLGLAEQKLQQVLPVPSSYTYTVSAYVRSAGETEVRLFCGANSESGKPRSDWSRLHFSGSTASSDELTAFGLAIQAGGSVEVCGVQLEAQPAASTYKSTMRGGIYPHARFKSDDLEVVTTGPGQHSCTIDVIHADNL